METWQLFFHTYFKIHNKISPVRDDSFQAGGVVHRTEPLPIVCRSSGTSILEYIGKYFKFRIEKKERRSKIQRIFCCVSSYCLIVLLTCSLYFAKLTALVSLMTVILI